MVYTTRNFWKGAIERAIKTFGQTLLSVLGLDGIGILDIDWSQSLSIAGAGVLASLLTSIASPDFVAGKPDVVLIEDDHA